MLISPLPFSITQTAVSVIKMIPPIDVRNPSSKYRPHTSHSRNPQLISMRNLPFCLFFPFLMCATGSQQMIFDGNCLCCQWRNWFAKGPHPKRNTGHTRSSRFNFNQSGYVPFFNSGNVCNKQSVSSSSSSFVDSPSDLRAPVTTSTPLPRTTICHSSVTESERVCESERRRLLLPSVPIIPYRWPAAHLPQKGQEQHTQPQIRLSQPKGRTLSTSWKKKRKRRKAVRKRERPLKTNDLHSRRFQKERWARRSKTHVGRCKKNCEKLQKRQMIARYLDRGQFILYAKQSNFRDRSHRYRAILDEKAITFRNKSWWDRS